MRFGSAQTFITAAPGSVNVTTPALYGTPTAAGSYTINLQAWEDTDGTGIVSSTFVYQIDIAASPNAPAFTTQPVSVRVTGGRVALVAVASNRPAYQWWNGTTAVNGATDPILLVQDAAAASGCYTCVSSNSSGSATSDAATIAAVSTSNPGRLTNLSCRAQVGTGADIMTTGFVNGGAGTSGLQSVLVRGSGPALGVFGLSDLLPDPKLTLNNPSARPNEIVATNAGWEGSSAIADEAAALGAFSWGTSATPDSALLESLPGDHYPAQIAGASGDTGLALIEVYDATPAGTYTPTTPRMVNLSALIQVGSGANVVFAGFVIGGSSAKTVLIRASGPALASAPFNLPRHALRSAADAHQHVRDSELGHHGEHGLGRRSGNQFCGGLGRRIRLESRKRGLGAPDHPSSRKLHRRRGGCEQGLRTLSNRVVRGPVKGTPGWGYLGIGGLACRAHERNVCAMMGDQPGAGNGDRPYFKVALNLPHAGSESREEYCPGCPRAGSRVGWKRRRPARLQRNSSSFSTRAWSSTKIRRLRSAPNCA